jgi:hypothetical protein
MMQMLLKPGRRESRFTPHPAPLVTEGRHLMARRLLLVVRMLVAVLVISGVALILSACGGAGASGGGEQHQQTKARPLPDKEYKALPPVNTIQKGSSPPSPSE